MERKITLSSSRTILTKFGQLIFGVFASFIGVLMIFGSFSYSFSPVGFVAGVAIVGVAFLSLFVGSKVSSLKVDDGKLVFRNIFAGKPVALEIDDFKPYLASEFKLSFFDPLRLNKFVIYSHKKENGNMQKFFVLSPSRFSQQDDILKSIKELQSDNAGPSSM